MTLDLLVTHYNEPFEVVKPLLDSVMVQSGINFDDIHMIIVNDGSEELLDTELFRYYPFKIDYLIADHKGVSAARNLALDSSSADYVMFCDCDDSFMNIYGLHTVFSAMVEGFDVLVSPFVEEVVSEGSFRLVAHENNDSTFIHGKVYNRKFLADNNIRFDENLTIHEDGYFNVIAITAADNKKQTKVQFYAWKYNPNSVVRSDKENYLYKTYAHVVKARMAIARELKRRGFINEYISSVVKTFTDAYYDFQRPECFKEENRLMMARAEKEFKKFYNKYFQELKEANVNRIAEIMTMSRNKAYTKGFKVEKWTLEQWIKHLEEI